MDHSYLTQVFESGNSDDPLDEILTLLSFVVPNCPQGEFCQLHQEIADFFSGGHSEYRSSDTKYHNLGHTYSVVLAATRLFHGLFCEERYCISGEILKKAMYGAYFHDCGFLLKHSENASSGAAYTKEHEARSILFMESYLQERGVLPSFIADCSLIIQCTNLNVDPDSLAFSSEEIKLAGFVVGCADILAQMADRYYLERLPLLFQEHKEGGITVYNSAVELMQHTTAFYHDVIIDRFQRIFLNIFTAMRTHFRERWNLDRNLYIENINNNISYINSISLSSEDGTECLEKFLRRKPPC